MESKSHETAQVSNLAANERPTVTVTLPAGWARAGLAGVEGALLGWAIPALGALLVFLLDSGNPWLAEHSLTDVGRTGTDLWVLSLGGPIVVGALPISLIPLTWTACQVLILRALLLRGQKFDAAAQWAAVPGFFLTALLIIFGSGRSHLWVGALPGIVLIPLIAALWAVLSQSDRDTKTWMRIRWLTSGLVMGSLWFGVALVAGLVTVVVAAVESWPDIMLEASHITPQNSPLLPTLLLLFAYGLVFAAWGLAWLAGPGFILDDGLVHSLTEAQETALRGVPVAALVPETAPGSLLVLIPLGIGLVVGLIAAVKLGVYGFKDAALRTAAALGGFSGLAFVFLFLSGGSLGVKRLAYLGPTGDAWWILTLEVAGLASLLILLLHPVTLNCIKNAAVRSTGGTKKPRDGGGPERDGAGGVGHGGPDDIYSAGTVSGDHIGADGNLLEPQKLGYQKRDEGVSPREG